MSLRKLFERYGLNDFAPEIPDVDRPTELGTRLDVLERELGLTDAPEPVEDQEPDAEDTTDETD